MDDILNIGKGGLIAGMIQTSVTMGLKTTLNYQYTNGLTTQSALKKLYSVGGVFRFYRGFPPAVLLNSITKFNDTFISSYVLSKTKNTNLHLSEKIACSSVIAATTRIAFMPLDNLKTNCQVNGKSGYQIVANKVKTKGVTYLWSGTLPQFTASILGHFPWYFTYNYLNEKLDHCATYTNELIKQGAIGFTASLSSDLCVNGFKVLKSSKQTSNREYSEIVKTIIKNDGYLGFYRGLGTKLIINGVNGMVFSIVWKIFRDNI